MSPRGYRLGRRAESAEETRRRIVDATFQLHSEKGIGGTTLRDIAQRAGVAIGTVYNYFPQYDDVIVACGALAKQLAAPPTAAIFEPAKTADERVRLLVREVFAFYSRMPAFEHVRAERSDFEPIEDFCREEETQRRFLIETAFRGSRAGRRVRALAFALLDFTTWQNLLASGLSQTAAVEEVSNVLLQRSHRK